jgi:hypothetical protein
MALRKFLKNRWRIYQFRRMKKWASETFSFREKKPPSLETSVNSDQPVHFYLFYRHFLRLSQIIFADSLLYSDRQSKGGVSYIRWKKIEVLLLIIGDEGVFKISNYSNALEKLDTLQNL